MNPALEAAIKEAYAIAPSGVIVYDTLEIRQTGVQSAIFLVKSNRELVALDENGIERTFEPSGFSIALPASNAEGFRSLSVAVDNLDRRASDFIQAAKDSRVEVEVIYRPYVSTDLTQPQMNPPLRLFLKDVQLNEIQVIGKATFMDVVNRRFPSQLYTREMFPALG